METGGSSKIQTVTPLVTVLTLCYNMKDCVIKSLECIKNQTYTAIEHIIIDDYSTDGSVKLIDEWIKRNNYNCIFIKRSKNLGGVAGYNEGLVMAKGKYFCEFSDDLCVKERFEKQVKLIESANNVAFVCTNCDRIDENDNYVGTYFPKDYTPPNNAYLALLSFDNGTVFCTPSVLFNTQILRTEGKISPGRTQGDYEIFLKLTKKYNFIYRREPVVSYRVRMASLSRDKKWIVPMRKDTLDILTNLIKPDNYEEKIAIKKGIVNMLKSNYYYLNTNELESIDKNNLYIASSKAIKYLLNQKFPLTFSERMFLLLMRNKIPYKFSYKFLRTLNPEFKM
jgi:glycosyltransferase involved in cell wall biosynthesis